MKRRRKTTSVSYELKKAVILLERCDASDRPVSKVARSVPKSLPHVDIVDYSQIQEQWIPNQDSHLSAHKSQLKRKKKPVTEEKSSQKNKKRCDRKIVVNEQTCPDILTTEVSCAVISVVKAGSLDISAIGRCLLEASIEESSVAEPGIEGSASPEGCHEVSDVTASCLGDIISDEISLQDEILAGSSSVHTEAVETTKDDVSLMETGEENELITSSTCTNEYKIESVPDEMVGFVNCGVVDNEMPLLVSEDVEKMAAMTEEDEDSVADPSATDSLFPFDEMPLLNIEGDCTCLMNLDHCPPDNPVNGEQVESFFVPDHSSDLFLCENPSAVFTSLNSDVMLGDIGNRLSLFEEEVELMAVSGGKLMETAAQETVDFGDSGFAVDELDWNCEQTWPLPDPMGESIQNGQGLLNSSLDAKDSEDEFRQKMTEEVFTRHLSSSLHLEDQEKKNLSSSLPLHLDSSLVLCAVVEDNNITVASDQKFDANKSSAFPQNTKQNGGEHQEGTAVEASLDGDHRQKSPLLPTIKQKEVKFVEDDQRKFKMKPLMNFSLSSSSDKSFRDLKEENLLPRKPIAASTDIRMCDDKYVLSKTLLKGCEATKLKYSKVRTIKQIDVDVDEMQKTIVRVTTVKSSSQNKHYSATAPHNSVVHCVQEESLWADDDQSFINRDAAFGFSNGDKPDEEILVSVQKTGNLLEDPLVSTESSLQKSLCSCPTLEVVLQPEDNSSTQSSKQKLSVKAKTLSVSDRQKPLSREGVLDAQLDSVTNKSQKKDKLDVKMNHRVLRAKSDSFSSAVQKAERLKTDLEILRNKIRSDLCDLLLARLGSEMPSERVTNMAFDIEFELWSVSKHLSSIYKQRASSLMRILRRSSSQRLCDRLLSSEFKPHHLVQNMTRYLHNAVVSKDTEKESIVSHSDDVRPEMMFTSHGDERQTHDVAYRRCAGRTVVSSCSREEEERGQEQLLQRPSNAKLPKRPKEPDEEKQQSVIVGIGKNSFQRLTPAGSSCEAVQLRLREMSLEAETVPPPPHLNNVLLSSCMSPHFTSSLPFAAPDEDVSNASSFLLQSALSLGLTVADEAPDPLICSVNIDSVMNSLPDVIADNVALGSSLVSRRPQDEPPRLSNASDEDCCVSGVDGPPTVCTDRSSSSSVNARAVDDDRFKAVPCIIVSKYSESCQSNESLQNPTTCSNENRLSSPCEAEFLQNGITQEVTIRRDLEETVGSGSLENVAATSFLLLSSNDSRTSMEISDSMKPVTHSSCKQTAADDSTSIKPDVESNMFDRSTDVLHEVENIRGSNSNADLLGNISVNEEKSACSFKTALEMNALGREEKLLPLTTGILVELNELESSMCMTTNTDILIENPMALDKCQQNTVNSDENNLSVNPDECQDSMAKEFCDPESYSEPVSDDNAAVSLEATHSKDCQEDPVSNTLNTSSIVSLDAVNSSGDAEETKSAVSDSIPVAVLDEESCQTFSDHFMDLCDAQTTGSQKKVLVELNKTAEKVSDIENEKTDCKSESSAGEQCEGLVLDFEQGSLNRNECVLKSMQLDNAESLQSGNLGSGGFLERQHSKGVTDESIISAAECSPLSPENLSNEVCCLASLETELDKSSEYKQSDSSQLSGQNQTLKSCSVVKRLQGMDVAASLASPCAWAAQAHSEIPSHVSKTNVESILPVLCDGSAETLTTVDMPTKSVVSVSCTMASVCSLPNSSQSLQLHLTSKSSCAPRAGSSSFVSSSPSCSSVRSSSVLFGCNQMQSHSLFLAKDIGHSQLPLGPRCPLLLSKTRFLATVPQQLSQQRAPNELFPIHSGESLCKSHSQSNIVPNPKSPLNPVAVRNPLLPRLENQNTWQSRGHHKEYDNAFACKTFHSRGNNVRSYFLNFPHRLAGRPLLESQSSQQFRQPLIELKIRPSTKNNGCGERPQSSAQRMTANSDAYHSSIDDTGDGNTSRHSISNSEGQNLAGQLAANAFCIVHEDSEFPQPDNSALSSHRNLFNSTYLEENYSGNSYEFFGSSEENLEKFLPHLIPMSATDYLDKSKDNDNQQVNVCSQLEFGAEGNDFADTADTNKITPLLGDKNFVNNRELRRDRRSESANEFVGRTMIDVDRRLSNHEINSLRNGFGLDCPESLRIPNSSFPKTKSRFGSFDACTEIASIEADTFNVSDDCRLRDQSSTAGHPHRSRRRAEETELPFFRDSFHSHHQNYGRELSSNLGTTTVDLPFASSRGIHGHEPPSVMRRATGNQRHGTEQHRGFPSDNGFCLSQPQLRDDDCKADDEPSGNSTGPVFLRNPSSNRQRQNFSHGDFKRRRLEDRFCDGRWIHRHALNNERVADNEMSDLISPNSYSSEQARGLRHGRSLRPPESRQNASQRRLSFRYSDGDNRTTRRHLIDYEWRTAEFTNAEWPQVMRSDIRQRLCDIAEGLGGSYSDNSYQHCAPFGIHEHKTGSKGRISYGAVEAEGNMFLGFSSGSILDEGLNQGKGMIHQWNSSDESNYLSSDGFTSRERKPSLNRRDELHAANYEQSLGHYEGNRSLFHGEQSGSCRVSRTRDDESRQRRGEVRARNRYEH